MFKKTTRGKSGILLNFFLFSDLISRDGRWRRLAWSSGAGGPLWPDRVGRGGRAGQARTVWDAITVTHRSSLNMKIGNIYKHFLRKRLFNSRISEKSLYVFLKQL